MSSTAAAVGVTGGAVLTPPAQLADPVGLLAGSGPLRSVAAFLVVMLLGSLLIWRYGPFVDRAMAASMDRPVAALAYGVASHAVIAFGGIYLVTRLSGSGLGRLGGAWGLVVVVSLIAMVSVLGFTVVGTACTTLALEGRTAAGPVVGAVIAGVAAGLDPLAGGVVWFVTVSMGIGGSARRWLHADMLAER